jgi:hypothetical protein
MMTVSADRIFGEAILYVSSLWDTPALASVGSIQMNSISSPSAIRFAKDFNGPLTRLAVYERITIVPFNFSLSFDLKPFGIITSIANIIHYTQDRTATKTSQGIPGTLFPLL